MQTAKDELKKENPKQILSSLEYDDAGNTLDIKSGFGYNGEKMDETGNIYLRARYYNPRIGQFVQIDSFRGNQSEVSSQQRYTYVANNQYKYIDPSGHFGLLSLAGGLVALGKAAASALIAATPVGWAIAGGVAIVVGGVAIYKYNQSKSQPKDITLDLPYNPPKGNTRDNTEDKGKTGGSTDSITGGSPGTIIVPTQPVAPTLKLPQPCPDGFGWEQIPKHIVSLIIGLCGAQAWVNEFLGKLERVKHHSSYQTHHIVAKKSWDECGRVKHDFYLNVPREVLNNNFEDGLENKMNKVLIINTLHRCIHTKLYYWSIKLNFNGSLKAKTPANKAIIESRLNAYQVILRDLSDKVEAFFK